MLKHFNNVYSENTGNHSRGNQEVGRDFFSVTSYFCIFFLVPDLSHEHDPHPPQYPQVKFKLFFAFLLYSVFYHTGRLN